VVRFNSSIGFMGCAKAILLSAVLVVLLGCHESTLPVLEIPPAAMVATGSVQFVRVNKHPASPPVSPQTIDLTPGSSSGADRPKEDIKVGIKVPEQPGYIRSPYPPGAGLIDARGMPPGAEIYDPYSGNTLLVP
jgi:hypothetical protein